MKTIEEDRLILHDLRGVNLQVGFFLGTREELLEDTQCISYSVCYESVDVRVDQLTYLEPLYGLDFFYSVQQLLIDDQIISGDVLDFRWDDKEGLAFCKIALGRDY